MFSDGRRGEPPVDVKTLHAKIREPADLALMRRIDQVHLEMPWYGARGLRRVLKAECPGVGRRHIAKLMLDSAFCVAAVEDAIARHGRPEIFNTD